MSFLDDCYEDMMIEQAIYLHTVETYRVQYSNQQVVDDAIQSFRGDSVDEESRLECTSRDILKTIVRTKRVSPKQKACLVKMLVYRNEDKYELEYGF